MFRMVVAGSSKATVPTSIKESQGRGRLLMKVAAIGIQVSQRQVSLS